MNAFFFEVFRMKDVPSLFMVAFFLLSLLCSCSTGQGGSNVPKEEPLFGWRSAGLMPNLDSLNNWGTGFMAIAHSRDYIFVRDSRVADLQTLEPTAHRIFMSGQGSEAWKEIELPSELKPFKMYGDDNGLYVGSYGNGQVWRYEPDLNKWTKIIDLQLTEKQKYNVYAITKFNGRMLVNIAGYNGTVAEASLILYMQPDGSWENIAPPDSLRFPVGSRRDMIQLNFTGAREWRGKLFTAGECGIFSYDNASWQKLSVPGYTEEGRDAPYVIELHKDRIYVGQNAFGGVEEVQEDYSRVQVDSNFATDGSYSKMTPIYVKTLISTGEHLIVAGKESGLPKVYMGDKGEPKGWRRLGYNSWCPPGSFRCIAITTYGFDIVGDTLYAAAWEGVFKFPLSDLDSAIANENSYYSKED
jgi:hypothetical protein